MHDKNGTEICKGDYVAFPISTGRDIGQIIEITPGQTTCNIQVLAIGTHEVSGNLLGFSGILRKVEDKLHVHYAANMYLNANECELVMLADGSLPVLEQTKAPALDKVADGAEPNPTPLVPNPPETGVARTDGPLGPEAANTQSAATVASTAEEVGTDGNGSLIPPIPLPAG